MSTGINNDPRCQSLPTSDGISPYLKRVALGLYLFAIIYAIFACSRFLYYFNHYERLKKRKASSTFLVVLGCIIQFHAGILQMSISLPCSIGVALALLVIPVSGVAIPLRLAEVLNRHIFSKIIFEVGKESNQLLPNKENESGKDNDTPKTGNDEAPKHSHQVSTHWDNVFMKSGGLNDGDNLTTGSRDNKSVRISMRDVMKGVVAQYLDPGKVAAEMKMQTEGTLTTAIVSPEQSKSVASSQNVDNQITASIINALRMHQSLKVIRYFSLARTQMIISFVLLLPFLLYIIIDISRVPHLNPDANCYYCAASPGQAQFIIATATIFFILSLIAGYPLRKVADPFGVISECKLLLCCGILSTVGYILQRYYPDNLYPNVAVSWLTYLGMICGIFVSTDLQVIIAQRTEVSSRASRKLLRKQIVGDGRNSQAETQVSSVGPVNVETEPKNKKSKSTKKFDDPAHPRKLKALLEKGDSDPAYALFEKHLVSEFSIELLRMYQDCEYFAENYFDMSSSTKLARAKRICSLYLDSDAIMQVNLPHRLRLQILEQVTKVQSVDDRNLFRECQHEILLMLHGAFTRFIRTDAYIASIAPRAKSTS